MQEMHAFKGALRGTFEPVHLADTDPEYMALAGGAMAALRTLARRMVRRRRSCLAQSRRDAARRGACQTVAQPASLEKRVPTCDECVSFVVSLRIRR